MIERWRESEVAQVPTNPPPALLLPKNVQSPRAARAFAHSVVEDEAPGACADHLDTVALVVSELVTNAVRYGSRPGDDVQIVVDADMSRTRVEVIDRTRRRPRRRRTAPEDTRGRGLLLLDALTDRWGFVVRPTGKAVWAEVQR
ncbi:ATP-binding protein [Streptomyces sp. SID4919]|uniref:ATP-binding protein n=1 Tax=unclassified Streptomyces TaxID=2593676 RepID=UPI0008238AA7|nr:MULTISPECIES: ATP-binding protein [unclassified Streptomyces]MYY10976.1 ATP-binding protein [Streptomyces sp. SID4919]SCK56782.1 Histidine kinase-like ATPase domain-containing protein [Streptomyces sp. AmelKG-E11A]